jgi:type III pantothenate kinase
MILTVDAGNTTTVFAVGRPNADDLSPVLRFATRADDTAEDWAARLLPAMERGGIFADSIRGVAIASVVPAVTTALIELCVRIFKVEPLVVSAESNLGITIDVDAPLEVGADRIANSVAAFELFGGPTIVVDLGTATKIESISASGSFRGGVIAPGIGVSLGVLVNRAARLYAVPLTPPPAAIGKNTTAAVQSGVVLGHVAMIEGMLRRVAEETESPNHVVLTGGYAGTIGESLQGVTDVRPDLTLVGVRRIYSRHRHT